MITFKDFLYDGSMFFSLKFPGERTKTFDVIKLNEPNSLPSIKIGDINNPTLFGISKVVKDILLVENIETPFGNINTFNNIIYVYNFAVVPVIREMMVSNNKFNFEDQLVIFLQTLIGSGYPSKYLDYYYTNIDMKKLKKCKNEFGIQFDGYDKNNLLQFSFNKKIFKIHKFLSTCYENVYVPKIEFDKEYNLDEIKIVLKLLIKNNFDFGEKIGKIIFENGIILKFNELNIPVIYSTIDYIENLIYMIQKNNTENIDRFPGLIFEDVNKLKLWSIFDII